MCLIERLLQPLRNLDLQWAAATVVITQSINDGVTEIRWRRDGVNRDVDAASIAHKRHFVADAATDAATATTKESFVYWQNADHASTESAATTADRATTAATAAAG
jgi:hypothetical protein